MKKGTLGIIIAVVALGLIAFVVLQANKATAPTVPATNTGQNASQNEPQNELKEYTAAEVAAHNTAEDCWTIINDGVYDITSFIRNHPGGEEILRACGRDATTLFTTRRTEDGERVGSGTPHSAEARSVLSGLQIGTLAE